MASTPYSSPLHKLSEGETRQLWAAADCVCFDVDSTVCQDEGLDELAEFSGVGDKVKQWTKKGQLLERSELLICRKSIAFWLIYL